MKQFSWLLLAKYVGSIAVGYAIADMYPGLVSPERFLDTRRQVAMLVVLPFLETLVLQLGVIEVIRWMSGKYRETAGLWAGALVSALLFFFLHYRLNGAFNGLAYGAVGGLAYASMYALKRPAGLKAAFAYTWLLHVASNAMLTASYAYFAKVILG
jgi:hypothetical protein